MMTDKDGRITESYLQEQWEAADSYMDAADAARMKEAIDLAIKPVERPRRRVFRYAMAVSFCSLCLVAALALGTRYFKSRPATTDSLCYANTDKGQRVSMTLPDGTRIWLNSDSQVSFPSFDNASSRDVYLKGECYFEVAKDESRPFIVHTGVYDVTAVGTSFNVRAYGSDETVKTTLIQGEVKVNGEGIDTRLLPNESITYDRTKGTFLKEHSELSYYDVLWHGNELVVPHGTTLEQLTRTLERNYNIQFKFTDETIKGYTFEGVIKNNQFTNVLDVICLSAPVSYRMEDDHVVFSKK